MLKKYLFIFLLPLSLWGTIEVTLTIPGGWKDETFGTSRLHESYALTLMQSSPKVRTILKEMKEDISGYSLLTVSPSETLLTLRFDTSDEDLILPFQEALAEAVSSPPDVLSFEIAKLHMKERSDKAVPLTYHQIQSFHDSLITKRDFSFSVSEVEELPSEETPPPIKSGEVLIDGKIYMSEPKTTETRSFGLLVGAICFLATFGLLILSALVTPLLTIVAVMTFIPGVYMTFSEYYEDPAVIAECRTEDLKKGFLYAFQHGRAGLTLTPKERRPLFCQDFIMWTPHSKMDLKEYPAFWIADLYPLHAPLMTSFLSPSEVEFFRATRSRFVIARNDLKEAREEIDYELQFLLAFHQQERDVKLDQALLDFSGDPYVKKFHELEETREKEIAYVEKRLKLKLITEEEAEREIEEINQYYGLLLSDIDLLEGVDAANKRLEETQKEIMADYEKKVDECKEAMRYHERVAALEQGISHMTLTSSQEIVAFVRTMTPNDPTLIDWIDLRKPGTKEEPKTPLQ